MASWRNSLIIFCLLLVSTQQSESFCTIADIRRTSAGKVGGKFRSETSISVVMGGSGTDLTLIPTGTLHYQDNILENVNARSIALLEQFQDTAGLHFVSSQDSLSQAASTFAEKSGFVEDIVVGGSSIALSAIPGDVMDSVSDKIIMMDQLDGTALAATMATSTSTVDDLITDNSQKIADIVGSSSSSQDVKETASVAQQQLENIADKAAGTVSPATDQAGSAATARTSEITSTAQLQLENIADKAAATVSPSNELSGSAAAARTSEITSMAQQQLENVADKAAATVSPSIEVPENVAAAKTAAVQAAASNGEASNKVVALMEKTISSFDNLAAKSGDSLEDAAKQLSDQLYQSFGSIDSAQASLAGAPKYIAKQGDAALQGALDEAEKVFESGTSQFIEKGSQALQAAKETPVKAVLNNAMHFIEDVVTVILKTMDGLFEGFTGATFMGQVNLFQSSLNGLVTDTNQKIESAFSAIGQVSFEQIARIVLKELAVFVQALSKIFLTLIDALLKSFTGDTFMGHVHHIQANVDGAISDTTHQVTSYLNEIGQINIQQTAHFLVSIVAFLAKLMFQAFSAIVVVLSGQGISEWTIQTSGTVEQQLKQVAMQASETAMGVSESSISELGGLLIQLFENVSVMLVEGLQALSESFGVLLQPGSPLAGAIASDAAQSVTDSVSMLTANL